VCARARVCVCVYVCVREEKLFCMFSCTELCIMCLMFMYLFPLLSLAGPVAKALGTQVKK